MRGSQISDEVMEEARFCLNQVAKFFPHRQISDEVMEEARFCLNQVAKFFPHRCTVTN